MDGRAWAALTVLAAVLSVDAWIFRDALRRHRTDDDVVATVGPVTLSSPAQWLIGCLLLWIFVVPLYLVARRA